MNSFMPDALRPGPSIVAGFTQIIKSRVFGRCTRLACLQGFNFFHRFSAALRNI
jgi:hypothetical protein